MILYVTKSVFEGLLLVSTVLKQSLKKNQLNQKWLTRELKNNFGRNHTIRKYFKKKPLELNCFFHLVGIYRVVLVDLKTFKKIQKIKTPVGVSDGNFHCNTLECNLKSKNEMQQKAIKPLISLTSVSQYRGFFYQLNGVLDSIQKRQVNQVANTSIN